MTRRKSSSFLLSSSVKNTYLTRSHRTRVFINIYRDFAFQISFLPWNVQNSHPVRSWRKSVMKCNVMSAKLEIRGFSPRPPWPPVQPKFIPVLPGKMPGNRRFPTFCALLRGKIFARRNTLSSSTMRTKVKLNGASHFPDFPGNSLILFFESPRRLVASKPEAWRRKPWRRWVKLSPSQSNHV